MYAWLQSHPLNTLSWGIGALALFMLAYRTWLANRSKPNELAGYYIGFSLAIALCFFAAFLPTFFADQPQLVKYAYITSETFLYLSLVFQALILWYMGFKKRLPRLPFIITSALLGGVALILQIISIEPRVNGVILEWNNSTLAAYAQGAAIAVFILPIGFILVKKGLQLTGSAKIKTLSLGGAYLVVGTSQVGICFLSHANETLETTIFNIVAFSILFFSLCLPQKKIATKTKAAPRKAYT